jgi:hypothetical protein
MLVNLGGLVLVTGAAVYLVAAVVWLRRVIGQRAISQCDPGCVKTPHLV